ncbi:hypothetical protein [Pontimicrobium sp. IMCC45349]|jgi:hypothetical protein|uniref:hypothetical protein n=1 Tax=Pontimicrobium sp. IMCC45349 TaxID=3391574 RepID=UPI0039A256FF
MNGSLGHFKATVLRRKQRKEKQKKRFNNKTLDHCFDNADEFNFKKLSSVELKKKKEEIRLSAKNHKKKEIIAYILVMIITIVIAVIILK